MVVLLSSHLIIPFKGFIKQLTGVNCRSTERKHLSLFQNTLEITSARLTVFDVLGKTLLEKVADVTNNAKQCLSLKRYTLED